MPNGRGELLTLAREPTSALEEDSCAVGWFGSNGRAIKTSTLFSSDHVNTDDISTTKATHDAMATRNLKEGCCFDSSPILAPI